MKVGLTIESYNKIKNIINKYKQYTFKIFGSRARGDYKNSSDIDIAVAGKIDDTTKFNIRNDFDLIDIPYMIDLVFEEEITKQELLKSIEEEGVKFNEEI